MLMIFATISKYAYHIGFVITTTSSSIDNDGRIVRWRWFDAGTKVKIVIERVGQKKQTDKMKIPENTLIRW